MSYYGRGDRPTSGAIECAKAFLEGRSCKKTTFRTDGEEYVLMDNVIAQRVSIPHRVARKLADEYSTRDEWGLTVNTLRVRWHGYYTWTTARHLRALGFDATPPSSCRKTPALINGKDTSDEIWITPEYLDTLPVWTPPPKRVYVRFVNLTLPLFDELPEPPARQNFLNTDDAGHLTFGGATFEPAAPRAGSFWPSGARTDYRALSG